MSDQKSYTETLERFIPPAAVLEQGSAHKIPIFRGEWDAEGVYVYQAYRPEIADWAVQHQSFGGPAWIPARMTWIKPSFGWMLYRSGYGRKKGQTRVLKIKLSHSTMAYLLSHCKCVDTNRDTRKKKKKQSQADGGNGRVQWDPERDLYQTDSKHKNEPRRMLRQRAIQIGLAGSLSEYYASHIISIQDVTDIARRVGDAHKLKRTMDINTAMGGLKPDLPHERPYLPNLPESKLQELALLPGLAAEVVSQIGRGRVTSRN